MPAHISQALDALGSKLSIRQRGAVLLIPLLCLIVSLVSLVWLRQTTQTALTRLDTRAIQAQRDTLERQHTVAIVIGLVSAGVSLLSTVIALRLLQQVQRESVDRAVRLRDSKLLLAAIEDSLPNGVILLNSQGQIETLNAAASAMFGYEPAEVAGQHFSMLLADPPAAPATDALLQLNHQAILGLQKSGDALPIECSLAELPIADRMIVIINNLTQQEQIKAEFRSQSDEIAYLTQLLAQAKLDTQSVYLACYDLKASLQAIVHLSQWIEADLTERVREDTHSQMQLLRDRVRRMEELVQRILQTSPH